MKLIYEPWGLGDACIAAAIASQSDDLALACRSLWHPVISRALERRGLTVKLVAADPNFGVRRPNAEPGGNEQLALAAQEYADVFSIRGDPRDYRAMKRSYPKARIHMTGWLISLARRLRLFDFAVSIFSPPQSRYQQWQAHLPGPCAVLETATRWPEKIARVAIHVGAQWRSKQYPFARELRAKLEASGIQVRLLAGPSDSLPEGISDNDVTRVGGRELVDTLADFDLVITNDSGPMHVCYLAGTAFLGIFGTANVREWGPPGCSYMTSSFMPAGYRSLAGYASDKVLTGWPPAVAVAAKVTSSRLRG